MLTLKNIEDIQVVSFENVNRFNALISEPVKEELKGYYEGAGTKLVLNLEGIRFVDSTGFGVFLSVLKTANNNNGQFKICNVSPEVMELFKLLQLHNVFEIFGSLDECLKSFETVKQ